MMEIRFLDLFWKEKTRTCQSGKANTWQNANLTQKKSLQWSCSSRECTKPRSKYYELQSVLVKRQPLLGIGVHGPLMERMDACLCFILVTVQFCMLR